MKQLACLTLLLGSLTVHAATTSVVSLPFPIGVTGVPGLTATVTKDGPGFLYVAVQGAGFGGNFGPGDVVLTTGGVQAGPIVLDFSTPVGGIGARIQAEYPGVFEGEISAYDAADVLLGSFRLAGVSNSNGDDSAIFIGILSDSRDISRVVFNVPVAVANAERFAIGATLVQVDAAEAPEPGTMALIGAGLMLAGVSR